MTLTGQVVKDLKDSGWTAKNPRDHGEFGKAVHDGVSSRLKTLKNANQYYPSVVVENGTNKILSIGNGPKSAGTTEIDILLMKKGHATLKVGDILNKNEIKEIYDIKTTISGKATAGR